jgi:hypothetical protein
MRASLDCHPAQQPSPASDMYGGNLSAARAGAAIVLLLITLAIACGHNSGSDPAAADALSPLESSLGMPLP